MSEMSQTIGEYIKFSGGFSEIDYNTEVFGAQTDSRNIKTGNVFFAIKGEKLNGEDYIPMAFSNGASFAFASKECLLEDSRIIKVDNVTEALKKIAISYRKKLKTKVLAITGSVGKTSTKNYSYNILSQKYKTHKSPFNYNTVTGLSMAILSAPSNTEVMVLELGVDTIGEMKELTELTNPDIAIITNIGESHLERFKTKENIFREKISVCDGFGENSILVLNGEDDYLSSFKTGNFKVIKVFQNKDKNCDFNDDAFINFIKVNSDGTEFSLFFEKNKFLFNTCLIGEHFVMDASLSIVACSKLGVNMEEAFRGILATKSEKMRFERFLISGINLINDAYNSSFTSIMASVKSAKEISNSRLILALGDVLESGTEPEKNHSLIGESLSQFDIDHVFFYGELMEYAHKSYRGESSHFFDFEKMCISVNDLLRVGDTILIKGSRSMKMERLEDYIRSCKK